jgi:hypothetical protein
MEFKVHGRNEQFRDVYAGLASPGLSELNKLAKQNKRTREEPPAELKSSPNSAEAENSNIPENESNPDVNTRENGEDVE